jgi:voltage-gated potassium channel
VITLILCALGLTAVTVVVHGAGAGAAFRRFLRLSSGVSERRTRMGKELLLVRLVSLLLLLHLSEAVLWALFLVSVGALPTMEAAAYFSLTSYTTVGYGDVVLPERWRLLGPIEAAVGVLMLGWSTGILVAVIGAAYREQGSGAKSSETQ